MPKLQKSVEIIRQDGVFEFAKRIPPFLCQSLLKNIPHRIQHTYVLLQLIRANRNYTDARWLLNNKSDRHDALTGPRWNFHGPYVSFPSRAKHYYRYVFAANQVNDQGSAGKILDVASGTGYGVCVFDRKLSQEFDYTACDISQKATQYGNTYYSGAEYINGDAQNLPFGSDSFDTIVSFETMEHLPDIQAYLRELCRVSKNGSRIYISVPYDQEIDENYQRQRKSYPHVHSFELEDIKSLTEEYFGKSDVEFYSQQYPQNPLPMSRINNTPSSISKIESSENLGNSTTALLIKIEQ